MLTLTTAEAQERFEELLERVEKGEVFRLVNPDGAVAFLAPAPSVDYRTPGPSID